MFGYYDKGVFNMITNKFKKLFEQDDVMIFKPTKMRKLKKKHKDGKGQELIKGQKLKEIEVHEPVIPGLEFSRRAHWVKPYYVCEIEFLELTSDMKFRAPVFLRLRDDKGIEECTVNQVK